MTSPTIRAWASLILAVLIALVAPRCGGQGDGADDLAMADSVDAVDAALDAADAVADAGVDVPAPPPLTRECGACHDLDALTRPPEGSAGAPRDWLAKAGAGLVRDDPAIPTPDVHLVDPWPRRGHHDAAPAGACDACHPVDEQGHGHDLRTYPSPEAAFQGGVGCADGCHGWLHAAGSADPAALLLEANDTAHARVWRGGARADGLHLVAVRPGCGGCHNARSESHGALLTCLDCHTLGGPDGAPHQAHVAAIEAGQEALDPEAAAAGVTPCGYCHDADDDVPLERWRRGCHGCHLSGHQPVDETGQPQFWSIGR